MVYVNLGSPCIRYDPTKFKILGMTGGWPFLTTRQELGRIAKTGARILVVDVSTKYAGRLHFRA